MSDQETKEKELSAIEQAENILTKKIFFETTCECDGIDLVFHRFAHILSSEDISHLSVIRAKITAEIEKTARAKARATIIHKLIDI